jgi:hypothetical protein
MLQPPYPVVAEAEGVEACALDESAAIAQESAGPETVARATTSEIQVAEETEASLSQGAAGGETRTLELACTRGRLPLGLTPTPRMTRRPRRATPWSVG